LRRDDGKTISVPIDKLNDADRRFLESQAPADPKLPGLTLVEDGRPASAIVTNGRPMEQQALAASELQEHLRIMTGATVPIVKETQLSAEATSQVLILVGSSNRAGAGGFDSKAFEPESFVVKTTGDALILAGEDWGGSNPRLGTLCAVYDFLQDQLGGENHSAHPFNLSRLVTRIALEVGSLDSSQARTSTFPIGNNEEATCWPLSRERCIRGVLGRVVA
jgi:hypothetical protein